MIPADKLPHCLFALMAGGSAAALVALVLASASGVVGPVELGLNSPARVEVEGLLRRYRSAWHPSDRKLVVAAGEGQAVRFGPVIRSILLRPWHELAPPAVELAAAWRITAAVPELHALVDRGPVALRAPALIAADSLRPWPIERLLELVRDPEPTVQAAAFGVAFSREEAEVPPGIELPWAELIGLMADAPPSVREAATASLPAVLPDAAAAALAQTCDRRDSATVVTLLPALAKGLHDDRVIAVLVRLIGGQDAAVVGAALDTLADSPRPLRDPAPVFAIVDDSTRDDVLRGRAMRCLERTGSFDPKAVRAAFGLPPLARYFAARALLRSGDLAGAEMLVELAETAPARPGDASLEEAARAGRASRRLLAWLSGLRQDATVPEFRDWIAAGGGAVVANLRHLPAAPF